MRVSYLELYNEELFDLLNNSMDALRLKIYEDATKKVGKCFARYFRFRSVRSGHMIHLDTQ